MPPNPIGQDATRFGSRQGVINVDPTSGDYPADVFVSLESRMERMALRLNKRREFFRSLQRRRDEANQKFPVCTRDYRQWFAQSLVWKQWCEYYSIHCPSSGSYISQSLSYSH